MCNPNTVILQQQAISGASSSSRAQYKLVETKIDMIQNECLYCFVCPPGRVNRQVLANSSAIITLQASDMWWLCICPLDLMFFCPQVAINQLMQL